MSHTTFLFYTNCRIAGREQELSDWYDRIHIPDVVAVPGFTACTRYRLSGKAFGEAATSLPIKATWLSVVETELEPELAKERLAAAAADWHQRGRMSELFEVVASDIVVIDNPTQRPSWR